MSDGVPSPPGSGDSVRWVVEDVSRGGGVESVVRSLNERLRARGVDSLVVSWLEVGSVGRSATPGPGGWLLRKIGDARTRNRLARAAADKLRSGLEAHPGRLVLLEPGSLDVARHLVGAPRWGIHVHRTPDLILRPWRHLGGEEFPRPLVPLLVARMWWVGRRHRRILRSAPFVVTLTSSHTDDLARVAQRTFEIANPIDCSPIVRSSAPGRHGVVNLGYLGRLSWEKGPDVLIEALAVLDPDVGPVRTRLAGRGPLDATLRARVTELGLSGVEFRGWVDDPQALLADTDVLVLPSRAEAVPLVLVEALAAGCRIVACDAGAGVRDVIGNGALGVLVPPQDPEALSRALLAAVRDVRRGGAPDPRAVAALVARHDPVRVVDAWQALFADRRSG